MTIQNINKINVFGGTGFIGNRFCEMHLQDVIINDRNDYTPSNSNILYSINEYVRKHKKIYI